MKLNKSVLRAMQENKGQYLGMFYMVLLSSFLFVFFLLAATNLSTNKDAYFADYVQGDIEFAAHGAIKNLPELEARFGVKLEGARTADAEVDGRTLRLFTANERVNIPAVTEGRLPSEGEIALDPQFLKANGYKIGGSLTIDGKAYTVSGAVCLPNYAYVLEQPGDLVNDPSKFGLAVVNQADLQTEQFLYSVKFDHPQASIYEQARPLKAALNEQGAALLSWDYAKYDMKSNMPNVEVRLIGVYSLVVPPFLMLLSAALVAAVLGRMVKTQTGVIGTLYASGYRRRELMRHYLRYPILLGASGGLVGGALGMAVFVPFLNLMLTFFPMPIKSLRFHPLFILLGTALVTAILCAGTYLALRGALSASPVALMRGEGKVKKRNRLEKGLRLSGMRFQRKFSIREQLRSLPRLAFLFLGVLAATALLLFGLVTKSSMDYLISGEGTKETLNYRYEYALHLPQSTPVPPGTEPVAGRKFVPDFDQENRFEIIGSLPDSAVVLLYDRQGKPITLSSDRAAITKTMAAKYDLRPGDTIHFADIISDQALSLTITDIADTSLGDYIFVSLEQFDRLLGWEEGAYNAIMSDTPQEIDPALVYRVSTPENIAATLAEFMLLMNSVLYGIAVVAAVIAMIIIYILAAVSIDESRGSIALMKVFGYKKGEVTSLLTDSSRWPVLIGYVLGVPICSHAIGRVLTYIFGVLNLTIEPRLDWYFVLLGLVLILGAFELSKKLCLRKVARVPMSEALKAQKE